MPLWGSAAELQAANCLKNNLSANAIGQSHPFVILLAQNQNRRAPAGERAGVGLSLLPARAQDEDQMSSSPSGPAIISSATLSVRLRIAASNLSHISELSLRKALAFSRPWPIRTLS